MKKFITFFVLVITVLVAIPGILAILTISPSPQVEKGAELSFDKVKRVKQLIKKNKPRFLKSRQTRTIRIHELDLNLLLDYGVSQGIKTDDLFSDIHLLDHLIILEATLKIPKTFLGEYANLSMGITHDENRLELAFIRIGKLKIPGRMIAPLIPVAGKLVFPPAVYQGLKDNLEAIKTLTINDKRLTLAYDWNPRSLQRLHENGKALLIPLSHQKKLVAYANQLTRILDVLITHEVKTISLARIIRPLFRVCP